MILLDRSVRSVREECCDELLVTRKAVGREAYCRSLIGAARKLAVAAYRVSDRPRLERAIATLRGADMNETDRLLADDWTQRLTFDGTGRLTK